MQKKKNERKNLKLIAARCFQSESQQTCNRTLVGTKDGVECLALVNISTLPTLPNRFIKEKKRKKAEIY